MRPAARGALVGVPVLLGALLAAFFLTLNYLFSDGPREVLSRERIVSYLLVLLAHAILGWLGARFGPGAWWTWAALACAPSVLLAALYAAREPGTVLFAVLYSLFAVVAAGAGAKVGRRIPLHPAESAP